MSTRWSATLVLSLVALFSRTPSAYADTSETKESKPSPKEGLSEEGLLRIAISLYDTGRYETCVDEFQTLLDPEESRRLRSPTKIETARVYHGACLIGVGRTLEAETVFRQAILDNPQMKTPDSLLFPEAVVELFLRVRESMLDEIRKAELKRLHDAEARATHEQFLRKLEKERILQLLRLASTTSVVERKERWVTFVPYGGGQFQNGNRGLGWFFLGTEAAVTSVFVTSLYLTAFYGSKTDETGVTRQRLAELSASQKNAYLASAISGWALLGLGIVGIVEANLAFTPEIHRSVPRTLPPKLRELRGEPKTPRESMTLSVQPGIANSLNLIVTGQF
jgi:hypothetical protein